MSNEELPSADVSLLRFAKIGLAVPDPTAVTAAWESVLAWRPRRATEKASRFDLDGSEFEIVESADGATSIEVTVTVPDLESARTRLAEAEVPVSNQRPDTVHIDPDWLNGVNLVLVDAGANDAGPVATSPFRRLNHIVVAVSEADSALARWRRLTGPWPSKHGAEGEVAHHVPVGSAWFGITATGTNADAISSWVAAHGDGIYAIGLQVDVAAVVAEIRRNGGRIIEAPSGQTFIHPKSTQGLLIDLLPVRPDAGKP